MEALEAGLPGLSAVARDRCFSVVLSCSFKLVAEPERALVDLCCSSRCDGGRGEVASEQAAAARGDDEPEASGTTERQGSAVDEWGWNDHSQSASQEEPGWTGWGWNRARWGEDQADLDRRGSWATSWGNYSNDASSHYA